MQRHFRTDMLQCLHLEMSVTHPALDGAKGMFGGFSALLHLLRVLVEPLLDRVQNLFMLPAGDTTLLGRGALILNGTARTGIGPVAMQDQSTFFISEMVD